MRLGWYVRRLGRMSPAELPGRVGTAVRQRAWASPARRPGGLDRLLPGERSATVALRRADAPAPESPGVVALVAAADQLLAGSWPVFHLQAPVDAAPDWFGDPLTGRTAPHDTYAFTVPYRDENRVGNVKFVWELSRHQAASALAAAWWATGDDRYAERAAAHLRSWWARNPFLQGVHWTSAIEAGLRLLSWTFVRALLADWPGVRGLFDDNDAFLSQLYHHQLFVRAFRSRGSSANNHLLAELSGVAASAAAFPWFAESACWCRWARNELPAQAEAQTGDDGLNREQASEYHLFAAELLLGASLAARMAGQPLPATLDSVAERMADALAATLDSAGRPPRYGDGDNGRGVLLDAPGFDHVAVVLDAVRALRGAAPWWPAPGGSVLGHLARLLQPADAPERAVERPVRFDGAGMTILRHGAAGRETWVRCDAGPHGFLSIAAHGHADALSVEVRRGGVEILADPGTYCYHGEPEWRSYFKGTSAHSTLRLRRSDQAVSAGPFLWLTRPASVLAATNADADAPRQFWQASHDGYRRRPNPATHHRRVELDDRGELAIADWIEAAAPQDAELFFQLGPLVDTRLAGAVAHLAWPGGTAWLHLPPGLSWTAHRGEVLPPLGWYSACFGHKQPAWTLRGSGLLRPGTRIVSRLRFA